MQNHDFSKKDKKFSKNSCIFSENALKYIIGKIRKIVFPSKV